MILAEIRHGSQADMIDVGAVGESCRHVQYSHLLPKTSTCTFLICDYHLISEAD